MSYHELLWWQAYGALRPLSPIREDISEARIIGALVGKSPSDITIDWFDKNGDEDYRKQQANTALDKIREYRAKKEAKNGKAN